MALPLPPNTTCDIYHGPNAPPAAPDIAGEPCHLSARFGEYGSRQGAGDQWRYTHVLAVGPTTDVRDEYDAGDAGTTVPDTVYVPDKDGTPFVVVFVERVGRGTAQDHKRVYLDRKQPTWPTNEL
ncbi:MAG TPA: hypothetical protein VNK04_21085 [Gemmataceae bacterium]|jgi:hypothetical protein|nr:hypothetical protein [Gemmataceae bacterium]